MANLSRVEYRGRLIKAIILLSALGIVYTVPIPVLVFKALLMIPLIYDLAFMLKKLPNGYSQYGTSRANIAYIELLIYSLVGTEAITLYYQDQEKITSGLFIVLIVSFSDILQFVFGKRFGSHSIGWPSPKKTYEGYIGALLIGVLGGYLIGVKYSMLAVLCGIFGDLFESRCKRLMDIDDSSDLLKEHGGWLDRVDGIFLAMIILYPLI